MAHQDEPNIDDPGAGLGADLARRARREAERAPVEEAGGGVAEGFEDAEGELIRNASAGDPGGTERILEDAGDPEDPPRALDAEADRVRTEDDEAGPPPA